MILNLSLVLPLIPLVLSIPTPTPSPTSPPDINDLLKRQSLPELLALASEAGIALPTDPAALLSLYPLATQLVQYLPTAPVLSVLETAVPPGFVSSVVHDPSFAASFEQAFASGAPPSWFSALPSDVQGYLHTWQVGSLASEVGSVEVGLGAATASALASSLPHSIIGANATSGSARFGPLVTGGSSGSESGTVTGTGATVLSGTNTPASSSVAAQSVAVASSRASTAAAPSTSSAGAPHEMGLLTAGLAAAVGAVFVIAL